MIKFNKHNVTNTETKKKARVHYSAFKMVSTGEDCVTIYAKDYGNELGEIFEDVENNSDIYTDYFEKDKVRLLKGHALYESALARCNA